jgi:hypothetical protein
LSGTVSVGDGAGVELVGADDRSAAAPEQPAATNTIPIVSSHRVRLSRHAPVFIVDLQLRFGTTGHL